MPLDYVIIRPVLIGIAVAAGQLHCKIVILTSGLLFQMSERSQEPLAMSKLLINVCLILGQECEPNADGGYFSDRGSASGKHISESSAFSTRVLSRIFGLGGKMLKVTVDGGCSHRLQFSRGVWGHAPPEFF